MPSKFNQARNGSLQHPVQSLTQAGLQSVLGLGLPL